MKKYLVVLGMVAVLVVMGGVYLWLYRSGTVVNSPLGQIGESIKNIEARPLDRYSFENLKKQGGVASGIEIGPHFAKASRGEEGLDYERRMFYFKSEGKRISGALNWPKKLGELGNSGNLGDASVIIMIHGFVEKEGYYSGFGTEKVAGELAKAGYVTLAPDFAGFGESDKEAEDVFAARFQTYTTVLDLLASVEKLKNSNDQNSKPGISDFDIRASNFVGMWGHSNGGQIALSVLEILGQPIPTVLWNPVSKPFPYGILYYTDTFDDQGKMLRRELAKFEEKYDVEKYDMVKFLDWITPATPILLQQGGADPWVPKEWSDELAKQLAASSQGLEQGTKRIEYEVYVGSDHNLVPKWGGAVEDLVGFYSRSL
ncbi:hypothetical protein A2721_00325 [Candidatus Gottesmanbacteria bacterium RIFCSPHIGHO2_01_FULL_47_48]|uniref:Serine aminopeptidase S33 domain-containing protein n=1 Tax=Candidatus Gottesmanbacteria bacterium RIFCSPHIGHO2_01_FULL_47_48 TaxID=1798381 RepID=A0A1F6A108_9BACT|nr:MAG: hypothetical protein A2721_00325 [Candidatus Gottesmanbacteria bacterium RIFCSPHIGHO2_01_FULL_47_48]